MSDWNGMADRLLRRTVDRVRDGLTPILDKAKEAADPDLALQVAMELFIEHARSAWPDRRHLRWRQGDPLRLLFAGYAGTRNTGADVRVEEMIRQFRHVLGPDNVDLSILTFNPKLTQGYFRSVKQIEMPLVFPKFLHDTVEDQHGVVACEGSMFKSKFSSALTVFMTGALGLATAGDKLAIAYGGEAGAMTPSLERMVERCAQDALVICRNEASRDVLARLNVKTHPGTDTAWTFDPHRRDGGVPTDTGFAMLRAAGWDGVRPVIAVAPINPFWWPVKPDLGRALGKELFGLHHHEHYRSIYFHKAGEEVARKQDIYLDGLAHAVRRFRRQTGAFVVCVGMEQLDREACVDLASRLGDVPVFSSDKVQLYEMVSLLRTCTYLLASRYHAIVTSMPGGVLSVGVTMDERIRNLMDDRGHAELCFEVEDPDLANRVARALERLAHEPHRWQPGIDGSVVRGLEEMGRMGTRLAGYVHDRLPTFPLPEGMGRRGDPWAHLPPLSPSLADLIVRHRATEAA
jgi:polysaccharide pyruvyl transferase WcaK-like protein